jgi:hypothetical protein
MEKIRSADPAGIVFYPTTGSHHLSLWHRNAL